MGINPAMFVDDVFDAYIMAKRQGVLPGAKKPEQTKEAASKLDVVKEIGKQKLTAIGNAAIHPTTVALTGAGAFASSYGPEWAGGPSEQDLAEGNRFDPKRMAKSVASWNVLGRAMAHAPGNIKKSITGAKTRDRAVGAISASPGLVGAGFIAHDIANDRDPDLARAHKYSAPFMVAAGGAENLNAVATAYDSQEALLRNHFALGIS